MAESNTARVNKSHQILLGNSKACWLPAFKINRAPYSPVGCCCQAAVQVSRLLNRIVDFFLNARSLVRGAKCSEDKLWKLALPIGFCWFVLKVSFSLSFVYWIENKRCQSTEPGSRPTRELEERVEEPNHQPQPPHPPPAVFNARYEKKSLIGKGVFSKIYLVSDKLKRNTL